MDWSSYCRQMETARKWMLAEVQRLAAEGYAHDPNQPGFTLVKRNERGEVVAMVMID
jgi:hypothetical protein